MFFYACITRRRLLCPSEMQQIAFLPPWSQRMKSIGQLGVAFQPLQKLRRHIELRRTLHLHLGAGPLNRDGLAQITFDGFAFRVDARQISESDLPGGVHIFRLLHEDVIGVVQQGALYEE